GYLEYSAPTTFPEFDVIQDLAVGVNPKTLAPIYVPTLIQVQEGSTQRSQASYGQASYDFGGVLPTLDGLKLTLGYRYTWDYRSDDSAIGFPARGPPSGGTGG